MTSTAQSCTTVPLNKLLLSPRNVRKTPVDEVDIETFAASIRSKGLLQNLVVSEAPGGRGFFEVDAGGCRLSALELLARRKDIPHNHPIPVIVIPRDDAAEASLAENMRIPMNPADEVVAFEAVIERYQGNGIVDRGEQVANLARRFGRDVRYVEQRLRLAALAPEILAALRDGAITLDAARAYAAVSDQALQLKVFAGQEKVGEHRVAAIRAAYAGKVYRRQDRIVRYVGVDNYLAAGGRVDLDLFMGSEDEEVLLDTALVDRLAKEQADADADRIAQEAGFRAGAYVPLTSSYFAWPKTPAGYAGGKHSHSDVPEAEKAEAVAILQLAGDGSCLTLAGYHFPKAEAAGQAAPAKAGFESEIERLARIRREKIEARAVRLAAPTIVGTPLEGRAFWPDSDTRWISALQKDEAGDYVVAILVKVPACEVEARLAAAERALDLSEAGGPDDAEPDDFDRADADVDGDELRSAEPRELEEAVS